jgi:hypothetical protein
MRNTHSTVSPDGGGFCFPAPSARLRPTTRVELQSKFLCSTHYLNYVIFQLSRCTPRVSPHILIIDVNTVKDHALHLLRAHVLRRFYHRRRYDVLPFKLGDFVDHEREDRASRITVQFLIQATLRTTVFDKCFVLRTDKCVIDVMESRVPDERPFYMGYLVTMD